MTFRELLATVIGILEQCGIPYMITGSLASSYHGEPRATRDADVVIAPENGAIEPLVDGLLAAGFYVDRDVARAAATAQTQFNAIGPDAMKVDFILRRDRPFSIEEFKRRQPADLLDTPGFVASAEDVILAKLEWAKSTGSDRQLDDVAGVVAIAWPLDLEYIERWSRVLGVESAWHAIRDAGDPGR